MKFDKNFLQYLFTGLHYEEFPVAATAAINTLTGQIVWKLTSHFNKMTREEHIPTLDERNELDENMRGEEFDRTRKQEQGYDNDMTQYEIANVCDKLRVTIYEQLCEKYDMAPGALIFQTEDRRPPFWPLPMTIEGYLLWLVRKYFTLSPDQQSAIHYAKSTYGEDQARVTENEIKRKNAARATAMKEIAKQVLTEVAGWKHTTDDFDAFCTLPTTVQIQIAESIQDAIFRRSINVLKGNKPFEEMKSDSDLIRGLAVKAANWLNQQEIKHLRGIIDYRRKQYSQYSQRSNPLLEKAEIIGSD